MEHHKKLAILVGGGPAPGINSVIGAATIRAALEGMDDHACLVRRQCPDHIHP